MPEHLKGRTLHIVGPEDDYDDEEGSKAGEVDEEYDQMQVPEKDMNKRENLEKQRHAEENKSSKPLDIRLTKHFKESKRFEPAFTGNAAFYIFDGNQYAVALNDFKISLFMLETNKVLSTFELEKEDINTFVVSPNERFLATSSKNGLVRVLELPPYDEFSSDMNPDVFKKMEASKVFKH